MKKEIFNSEYDIAVGGAGVAGIAAAVTAARSGAKVALIEKSTFPGGLATSGLVNVFLPLCDGNGNQILGGITEELLQLSIKYGPGTVPQCWRENSEKKDVRYMVRFSPAAFILALDEFLEENNVDIWYDTIITGIISDNTGITALKVFNKSGKGTISAKCTIDATGDADIAKFAELPLIEGTNNMTLWSLQASIEHAETAAKYADRDLLYDRITIGADESGNGHPPDQKRWKGINGASVTEYTLNTRRYLRNYFTEQIKRKGDKAPFPLALPSMPQFRKTRRIIGESDVTAEGAIENPTGEIPDWRTPGKIWQIPEGALIPKGSKRLLAAGRIISATDDDAWDAVRVIPAAAYTGELAGKTACRYIRK